MPPNCMQYRRLHAMGKASQMRVNLPKMLLDEFAHSRGLALELADEQVAELLPCLALAQTWERAA